MILSEERQAYFAHVIIDGIWKDDLVDYTDDDKAIRAAKKAIVEFVKQEGDLDSRVRAKVATLKRNVIEGTMEWDTMYNKYYSEEMKKQG